MSTRCQIGFYESQAENVKDFAALIYRHTDGYPEGTREDILPFLRQFEKDRGVSDLEYASARLVAYLADPERLPYPLSLGISKAFHGDIEYFYRVNGKEKTLQVFEVTGKFTDQQDPQGLLIEVHSLAEEVRIS